MKSSKAREIGSYPAGAFPWMKHGYMGLTYPRIDVALRLLFGCRRGLLFVAPVVLAAPFGLRWLWKQPTGHAAAVAAAGVAAYYFLFNASFLVWAAGWSYGPRYMAAGLPLLCVGLAPAWSNARPFWGGVLALAVACGAVFALMAISTTAPPPDEFRCPFGSTHLAVVLGGQTLSESGFDVEDFRRTHRACTRRF